MARVSVIILNWNGISFIDACLRSVEQQTYKDFEITVVDNGSTDGSIEFICQRFPDVRLISLPTNVGFAAGNNIAIHETQSDFVATINNDIILDKNWLQSMLASFSAENRCGMLASKILLFGDKETLDSTGIEIDRSGMAWNRGFGSKSDEVGTIPLDVFGPCAGAAVYSREMLADVGSFDEDYFAFYEDVDLAWRARLRGWSCRYVPEAIAFHHHSASARRNPRLKSYLVSRNKSWTIAKNYPMPQFLFNLPWVFVFELGPCLYFLIRHGDVSRIRGKWDAALGIGKMLKKRNQIQPNKMISGVELVELLNPIRNPLRTRRPE